MILYQNSMIVSSCLLTQEQRFIAAYHCNCNLPSGIRSKHFSDTWISSRYYICNVIEHVSIGIYGLEESILTDSRLPRGKFLQNLILNLIATCIGSSISLLGIWSAIQARNHTAPGRYVCFSGFKKWSSGEMNRNLPHIQNLISCFLAA